MACSKTNEMDCERIHHKSDTNAHTEMVSNKRISFSSGDLTSISSFLMLSGGKSLEERKGTKLKFQPPKTFAEIHKAIDDFKSISELIPPRPPPFAKCPGVYGRGCGGTLIWNGYPSSMEADEHWTCSNNSSSSGKICMFRYYPPHRLESPKIDILIVKVGVLHVKPFEGAEEIVNFCGGTRNLLRIAGVDLGLSLAIDSTANGSVHNVASANDSTASKECEGLSFCDISSKVCPGVCFPFDCYVMLRDKLHSANRILGGEAYLPHGKPGIPPATFAVFSNPGAFRCQEDEVKQLYLKIPKHIQNSLLPFQKEGILFGLQRHGRCLIADEMGVGKTLQAIALATCYREEWPLLIICPASLRLHWAEEIEKWLPDLNPNFIKVIFDRCDAIRIENNDRILVKHNPSKLCQETDAESEARNLLPQDYKKSRHCPRLGLPDVTIVSYTMFEHLSCDACKKSRKPKGSNPSSPSNRYHGQCMSPDHCMASMPWGALIIDESHQLRTTHKKDRVDALYTEAVRSLMASTPKKKSTVKRTIFLSGTPSLTRPYDLWNQVSMLRPGLLGTSKIAFADAYCGRRLLAVPKINIHESEIHGSEKLRAGYPGFICKRWNCSGISRAIELHLLLRQEVMLRRLKCDVLSQLPPKRRQVIRLPKPPPRDWPRNKGISNHEIDRSDASSMDEDDEPGQIPSSGVVRSNFEKAVFDDKFSSRMSPYHRVGIAKCRLATEWLLTLLNLDHNTDTDLETNSARSSALSQTPIFDENNPLDSENSLLLVSRMPQKCIVFAHHKAVMNHLYAEIDAAITARKADRKLGIVRIDGDTDIEGRKEAVDRFRNDPDVCIALLSVTAAGIGLDFSTATAVIFVELPSNVSLVRQAEDRAHRKGQTNAVNVYFLCARGTCDERHWQRLSSQLAKVGLIHDGPSRPPTDFSATGISREQNEKPNGENAPAKDKMLESVISRDKSIAFMKKNNKQTAIDASSCSIDVVNESLDLYNESMGLVVDEVTDVPTQKLKNEIGHIVEKDSKADDVNLNNKNNSREAGLHIQDSKKSDREKIQDKASVVIAQQSKILKCASMSVESDNKASELTDGPPKMKGLSCSGKVDNIKTQFESTITFSVKDNQNSVSCASNFASSWWFQVSSNSQRVHFHRAPDGSRPFCLSIPQEYLRDLSNCIFQHLIEIIKEMFLETQNQANIGRLQQNQDLGKDHEGASSCSPFREKLISLIGPVGVNIDLIDDLGDFLDGLMSAYYFAQEWRELGPIVRARLFNKILQTPLEDAVSSVMESAASEGAFGIAKTRFRDKLDVPIPCRIIKTNLFGSVSLDRDDGNRMQTEIHKERTSSNLHSLLDNHSLSTRLHEVRAKVTTKCGVQFASYLQAFIPKSSAGTDEASKSTTLANQSASSIWSRLCVQCGNVVNHCDIDDLSEEILDVDGVWTLFCSPSCERKFSVMVSGQAGRRILMRRDRGICSSCGLNCTLMLRRLQAIERGSRKWRERRKKLLFTEYKSFADKIGKIAEKIIERATPGFAWQADHIIPVYAGGGQCDSDNLRTLCTACHLEVTRAQAKERAAERRAGKRKVALTKSSKSYIRTSKKLIIISDSEDETSLPIKKRKRSSETKCESSKVPFLKCQKPE